LSSIITVLFLPHPPVQAIMLNSSKTKGYTEVPDVPERELGDKQPSVRSERRRKGNIILLFSLTIILLLLGLVVGKVYFYEKVKPKREKKALEVATRNHADAAAKRVEQCQGIDWLTACQRLTLPGARRLDYSHSASHARITNDMEDEFLHSEDPTVTYDENCLRVYRLHILGEGITFPYHASQLLRKGGNQTMALFIQVRGCDHYYWPSLRCRLCSC
jgi:hypothetical protein